MILVFPSVTKNLQNLLSEAFAFGYMTIGGSNLLQVLLISVKRLTNSHNI